MKIGFDAKRAFFNFRGLGNYSRTLILSFNKYFKNHSYYLYTPHFENKEAISFSKKLEKTKTFLKTPETFLAKMFPSWWRSIFLSSRIKLDKLDIFHGLSHELPKGIHKLDIKSVVTIHDLIFMRYPEFFGAIDRFIYKKKLVYSTGAADIIIAICEQTKLDLINFLKIDESKIKVIYQSCDPSFYAPMENDVLKTISMKYHLTQNEFILSVGAIEKRKNTLTLVKAFHEIIDSTGLDLVIVGKGKAYLDDIKEYINKHNIASRVIILESVGHEELAAFYTLAKMTAYPSLFEGFGIPIIESIFCKTPVITSKGSCFPESGGPGCLYIDPLNIQELAEAIISLDQDLELYQKLQREGAEYVQRFHHKNTSRELNDLYLELFNK